ncbi:MAG TPA: hypothetical protein VK826_00300, partial [Bacteroidia bacterium]|nr:hypothetical protein [Bacteroidia bacterium]
VLQSFSMRRPFGLATTAFLKLQATLMFIGGPYVWYIITYQQGYFANTVHETSPGWGGWLLIAYVIGSGMTLYWMLTVPKGKLASLFDQTRP